MALIATDSRIQVRVKVAARMGRPGREHQGKIHRVDPKFAS